MSGEMRAVTRTANVTHALDTLPDGATPRSVTATPVTIDGRPALRVALIDEIARHGKPGVDYVDQPTFLQLPIPFSDGTIEVDVRSRLAPQAPDYARGFAGVAYRISARKDRFEAVYLRPLNGLKLAPPAPRDRRAVQHFSYPAWPFDRLRETYPDGRFEAAADIGPDEWVRLRLDIDGSRCEVSVDGNIVLRVESLAPARAGDVGLFVDIGTEAFFADLGVRPPRG